MMKYTTIIWDLDGTLMNSLTDLWLSVNHALSAYGLPERTLEEVRGFVGNGVKKLMQRAVPDGENNPQFMNVFTEFKSYYVEHCQDNTALYPGMKETLMALKARGVRMAIVSNKWQAGVTELHNNWFADTMEVAIGEREGIRRKPAPDMVELALKELGVGKEGAVYVGDSDVDIDTAHNAGLPCISVLWGFRDKQFLTEHGADCFVNSPEEIGKLILNS